MLPSGDGLRMRKPGLHRNLPTGLLHDGVLGRHSPIPGIIGETAEEIWAAADVSPVIFPASPMVFPSGPMTGPEGKVTGPKGRIVFPLRREAGAKG